MQNRLIMIYLYFGAYRGDALKYKYVIAQNQSFVQKEIGVKYKTIHIWSYPQNLAIPCYY